MKNTVVFNRIIQIPINKCNWNLWKQISMVTGYTTISMRTKQDELELGQVHRPNSWAQMMEYPKTCFTFYPRNS
jgi:hypothetical protein